MKILHDYFKLITFRSHYCRIYGSYKNTLNRNWVACVIEKIKFFLKQRNEKKKEKLRKKNFLLRSKGKEPLKGWGSMINSGYGGINKNDLINTGKFDNTDFRKTQSEEIAKKNSSKNLYK